MDSHEDFKCRLCRNVLFSSKDTVSKNPCFGSNMTYLKEDKMPPWILEQVSEGNWGKGKLNCPSCNSRVGTYDFVSGFKCVCGEHVLPSVHVTHSRVDYPCPV